MGIEESKKWQKIINIFPQSDEYFNDETITGEVIITPLNDIAITDIVVSLQMEEKWTFRDNDSVKNKENMTTVCSSKLNLSAEQNTFSPIVNLTKDTYIFPFQLKHSLVFQPSFLLRNHNRSCHIEYNLFIEVICPGDNSIGVKRKIIVKGRPLPLSVNYLTSKVDIYKWGLMSKGSTLLSAFLKSNHFVYGDKPEVEIDIDNSNCEVGVAQCEVRLIRTIQFTEKDKPQLIHQKTYAETCFPLSCPPFSKTKTKVSIPIENPEGWFDTDLYFTNPYPFEINKKELWPTVSCALFTCSYSLTASVYFESLVFERPFVEFPIVISSQRGIDYREELAQANAKDEPENMMQNDYPPVSFNYKANQQDINLSNQPKPIPNTPLSSKEVIDINSVDYSG